MNYMMCSAITDRYDYPSRNICYHSIASVIRVSWCTIVTGLSFVLTIDLSNFDLFHTHLLSAVPLFKCYFNKTSI
jgi:hypothetical protein